MIEYIQTRYFGPVAELAREAGVPRSIFRQERREALRTMAETWNARYRDLHFAGDARRRYGYLPRKGEDLPHGSKAFRRSYTGQKLRRFGHVLPLVFSGQSRTLARLARVTATSDRARVILPVPGLNRRNPISQIDMRDEATRITEEERSVLTRGLDKDLGRRLRLIRATRTRQIK